MSDNPFITQAQAAPNPFLTPEMQVIAQQKAAEILLPPCGDPMCRRKHRPESRRDHHPAGEAEHAVHESPVQAGYEKDRRRAEPGASPRENPGDQSLHHRSQMPDNLNHVRLFFLLLDSPAALRKKRYFFRSDIALDRSAMCFCSSLMMLFIFSLPKRAGTRSVIVT